VYDFIEENYIAIIIVIVLSPSTSWIWRLIYLIVHSIYHFYSYITFAVNQLASLKMLINNTLNYTLLNVIIIYIVF